MMLGFAGRSATGQGLRLDHRERARTKVMEKVRRSSITPAAKGRPSDLYIWTIVLDRYVFLHGTARTADVLAAIGMKNRAARLAAEADTTRRASSIRSSVDEPESEAAVCASKPYRVGPPNVDSSTRTGIRSAAQSTCRGRAARRERRKGGDLEYWLEKYGLFSGLPAFMANSIDPTTSTTNRSANSSRRALEVRLDALQPFGLRDGAGHLRDDRSQNIVTGFNSDVWSASRQPHMHSNSRFIDLVRIALLLEDGGRCI